MGTVSKVYWSYLSGCHMHPVCFSTILWLKINKTTCSYHCVSHYKAVIAFSQKEKKIPFISLVGRYTSYQVPRRDTDQTNYV